MLRRPVAIKILPVETAGPLRVKRFEREVQLSSELTHPNTVTVYDYGCTPDGLFFYVMEYLEGVSLAHLVCRQGPQPPRRVVHILKQVCGSLAEAHDKGIIHRDIKPGNVLLCRQGGVQEVVKVVDFGLASRLEWIQVGQKSRRISGTPGYLAPETFLWPSQVDARSDLYAVGAVGYFLLTGRPVFDGRSISEVCQQHVHTPPIPPSARLRCNMGALEKILLRCLAKEPCQRPPSASELARELAGCVEAWTDEDVASWLLPREAYREAQCKDYLETTADDI